MLFKEHIQRGNGDKDPKHISLAGQHIQPCKVVPGPRRPQAWLFLQPDQRLTPGLLPWSGVVLFSWLPLQAAKRGQSQAAGLIPGDNPWLTLWAHPGVCKAFLGSSLAFEVRKFMAAKEEKEAGYRDRC